MSYFYKTKGELFSTARHVRSIDVFIKSASFASTSEV
jgi:hypothetical protein